MCAEVGAQNCDATQTHLDSFGSSRCRDGGCRWRSGCVPGNAKAAVAMLSRRAGAALRTTSVSWSVSRGGGRRWEMRAPTEAVSLGTVPDGRRSSCCRPSPVAGVCRPFVFGSEAVEVHRSRGGLDKPKPPLVTALKGASTQSRESRLFAGDYSWYVGWLEGLGGRRGLMDYPSSITRCTIYIILYHFLNTEGGLWRWSWCRRR